MQEGRKDVGCVCVCLPLGFVPCVCCACFLESTAPGNHTSSLPPFILYPPASLPSPSGGRRAVVMEPPGRCRQGTLARGRNRQWTRPLLAAAAQESWRKVGRRPRCWWGRPQGPGARQEAFLHTRVMLWLCFLPLGLPATSPSPVRVRRQEALVGCPETSGRLPTWL